MKYFSLIFSIILFLAQTEYSPDLVNLSTLPEIPAYTGKIYSGYLEISANKSFHYVFVESLSNPEKDPVVLWLNGGPGCSSLLGLLKEHGPFIFPDGSTKFKTNEYSWNKIANVLYLESPAGVGFSFAKNFEDHLYDDPLTAEENLIAVLKWFEKFPEYLKNEFYITGESYAGVYVPYLAVYIHNHNNKQSNKTPIINLKGIMVGNACTNYNFDCDPADIDMYWTHALYSPQTRDAIERFCPSQPESQQCQRAKQDVLYQVEDVNLYDIYSYCYTNQSLEGNYNPAPFYKRYLKEFHSNLKALGNLNCADAYGAIVWLNKPEVQKALHIFENITKWEVCNDLVSNNYNVSWNNASYWAYPILIKNQYKILVFSGDTDGCVPTIGTMRWIKQLRNDMGLKTLKSWSPWFMETKLGNYSSPQVKGFYEIYDGLTFVSVKGVGHLVPQTAGEEAFHIYEYYLKNKTL